jgi:outer membrane protein assembly factor BamD
MEKRFFSAATKVKEIIVFLVTILFCFNAYPFWIWSSKTKKWKNPQYSPASNPYLQFKNAKEYLDKKDYKKAYKEFKKLLINYPDAKEAAEGQYYLAKCLEELGKPYEAFLEYKKLIDSYPNSKRINEAINAEYNIGEYFLNREPAKWLGLTIYDFVEHPAIEIFKEIVDKTPYSDYAAKAQYKMGVLFAQMGRYDEARDAFQKVVDNYPDNPLAVPAKYQLALVTAKGSYGGDYDSSAIEEAARRVNEFIKNNPQADISSQAKTYLRELRDKEAKKNFDIALFYEKQQKYEAAKLYYKLVSEKFPETVYAKQAKNKIEELESVREE